MYKVLIPLTLIFLCSCTREVIKTVTTTTKGSISDSVYLTDTLYLTKPFFNPYKGDSVSIETLADSGLSIGNIRILDMTSLDSEGNYQREFNGSPDPITNYIRVPNYPISIVQVSVKYQDMTINCYMDLVGFQWEHILTDNRIHVVPNGWLASFEYVVMQKVFLIHARNHQ